MKVLEEKQKMEQQSPNMKINNDKLYLSRSAILSYKRCPYQFYLNYAYKGHGIVSNKLDLDTAIGSCIHRGLQHLLEHCRLHHSTGDFDQKCIDDAVNIANEKWMQEYVAKSNIVPKGGESVDFIIFEGLALIEAEIRAWSYFRLRDFLETYTILEVEKEIEVDFGNNIVFQIKPDGVLLHKQLNEIVILSIKTASNWYDVTDKIILHDMQGVSEIYGVENKFNKYIDIIKTNDVQTTGGFILEDYGISEEVYQYLYPFAFEDKQVNIYKVQYEYLLKGSRKKDTDGCYRTETFLLHPYKYDEVTSFSGGMFVNSGTIQYKWKMGQGRVAKGWQKCNIYEEMTIKEWIDMLATGQIQPEEGNPFQNIIRTPEIVNRDAEEVREWYVSTRYMCEEIYSKLSIIRKGINLLQDQIETSNKYGEIETRREIQEWLWKLFPRDSTQSFNFYGKDCTYVPHCYEGINIEDGIGSMMYKIREPHHEPERLQFVEKGFLEDEANKT